MPSLKQLQAYFRVTLQITQYYLSIELVATMGDGSIYIMSGEESDILISSEGEWQYV